MLGLGRVHRHIFRPRIFADDHSLVDFFLRTDKKLAPGLNIVERPGTGDSRLHGDERPGQARQNFADAHAVLFKHVAHDPAAAGQINDIGFESDQPAGGNGNLEVHAVRVVGHVDDLAFPCGQILEDVAETFVWGLQPKRFIRFEGFPVHHLQDHFGSRDEDFVAFPPHLFDQHRDLHFATGTDQKDICRIGVGHSQGDIGAGFFM